MSHKTLGMFCCDPTNLVVIIFDHVQVSRTQKWGSEKQLAQILLEVVPKNLRLRSIIACAHNYHHWPMDMCRLRCPSIGFKSNQGVELADPMFQAHTPPFKKNRCSLHIYYYNVSIYGTLPYPVFNHIAFLLGSTIPILWNQYRSNTRDHAQDWCVFSYTRLYPPLFLGGARNQLWISTQKFQRWLWIPAGPKWSAAKTSWTVHLKNDDLIMGDNEQQLWGIYKLYMVNVSS